MQLLSFRKLYSTSSKFEKREIIFTLLSLFIVILITAVYSIQYLNSGRYTFAAMEAGIILIAVFAFFVLLKGRRSVTNILFFCVLGSINLLKIMITSTFFSFNRYPFHLEALNGLQVIIIIAVAYFTKEKKYIVISILTGLINIAIFSIYHTTEPVHSMITGTLMFVLIPGIFAFHIMRNQQLLGQYYRNNFNRNREVNHRIKNQLSLLKSIIDMKNHDENLSFKDYKTYVSSAITSFTAIYDKLLYTEDIHQLNLYSFIQFIVAEYKKSLKSNIKFIMEDTSFQIDSYRAAHIGMIISELIGNSIKHSDNGSPMIAFNINLKSGFLYLMFKDDSESPASAENKPEISFGQAIIEAIIVDTLNGEYKVTKEPGYMSRIKIPILSLKSNTPE